ncbi:hypothetical protein HOP50_01g06950 [Chloropicon primus]|uniref:Uncharacterized protein n=1 Tax=Chloropicon primus TaxID=1764295 RepID=A0A5B8MFU1_9CHLO|nr:hypothetical protein A3770_01p07100 [Chloropicon primus]UPQ97404.1 hypothetical protein HOP50_01g06950 [Chloropicon primus]|eukprot:QDZ18192.1 hypothetical protein A3770_01p07100 [Chloropicon primus]
MASCAVAVALSLSIATGGAMCEEVGLAHVGLFGPDIEKDPIEPFTLYGEIVKKFFIENLDETGKIKSRSKGFTSQVCIEGLPISVPQKDEYGVPTCVEVVGQDFERTCDKACSRGCEEQIRAYLNKVEADTGFKLEPGEPRRLLVSCSKRCFKESMRPGMNRPFQLKWSRE